MTPVKQQFLHNPPETYGDCHRAALASLLDLPINDVPHFMHGLSQGEGEVFKAREVEFLDSRGLLMITVPVECALEQVFEVAGVWGCGSLFLLGGSAGRDCGHTVVAGPDGIVHDPHPRSIGIIGPMDDGFYWVSFVARKLAHAG